MKPVVAKEISTPRLVLAPLAVEIARAAIAGDLSQLIHAEGWPHDDTLDALRMAVKPDDSSLVWLVLFNNTVIGECGTVGVVDESGDIEIGYGLAAEHRGVGYGTEVVAGLSGWLISHRRVRRVVARAVLATNLPSRRALERAGFVCEREEHGFVWYVLSP